MSKKKIEELEKVIDELTFDLTFEENSTQAKKIRADLKGQKKLLKELNNMNPEIPEPINPEFVEIPPDPLEEARRKIREAEEPIKDPELPPEEIEEEI